MHHLVNLGGLIAVAGLDREPPDFLLGALVSIAHERAELTPEQRAQVASLGQPEARRAGDCQAGVEVVAAFTRICIR